VAVQRPEPDGDLVAFRPFPAEQACAANRAEGPHASVARSEDADQLLTGEQAKALARNASLRTAERPGVLPAARAVAVIGPEEGGRHLEAEAPEQDRGR